MTLTRNGLDKLTEEFAETLIEVAKLAQLKDDLDAVYWERDKPMRHYLQNELADALATISYVRVRLNLDVAAMQARANEKLALYKQWESEG